MLYPTPVLYQPTDAEIVKVTNSAKHRWPAFGSRIEKAADILLGGGLQLEPVAWGVRNVVYWRVSSQSHAGAYTVMGLGCPCQDSRAAKVDHTRFCKHAIAVASYLKILRTHLNADIRARRIDLGILVNGEFHAYADKGRMGYVQVRKMGVTYGFAGAASAVRYSLWLAAQQAVPVAWPVAVALAA